MGFHFYSDGWWRKPGNAVTADATIVEIGHEKRQSGETEVLHAGYYATLVADVSDPATGESHRAESVGRVYAGLQPFQVGQTIKVRWSAKRKTFDLYSWTTAPEEEWSGPAGSGPVTLPVTGAELSPDQSARVQQALGALGLGNVAGVQVLGVPAPDSSPHDPIGQLERLAALHQSGALTDEEFEQQKQHVLGEH